MLQNEFDEMIRFIFYKISPRLENCNYFRHTSFNFFVILFLAFNIGKGALAGGSVLGIGALCYYGAGLSTEASALDKHQ